MEHDAGIHAAIARLVDEEHALRDASRGGPEPAARTDPERLHAIEVELDRCWDLLRQRRARRDVGVEPDVSTVRAAAVVEHYLQ